MDDTSARDGTDRLALMLRTPMCDENKRIELLTYVADQDRIAHRGKVFVI